MGASLAEELGAAIEGIDLPSGETDSAPVESAPVESAEPAADPSGRDEQGRFAAKVAETPADAAKPADGAPVAATEPQTPEQQQAGADAKSIVSPPATWSVPA